jgi:hypothetical protein
MEHIRPELGYGPDAECELVSDSECVIGYLFHSRNKIASHVVGLLCLNNLM